MPNDTLPEAPVMAPPAARDGFALPLAIVVLALLTMGLVAGFAVASSEMSTTVSQRAQARAYSYAQMGLESFLTRRKEKTGSTFCPHCWAVNATVPPANSQVTANLDTLPTRRETVYVAFNKGFAIVRATPVWLDIPTGKGTYFITSTGYDNEGLLASALGRTKQASRTVGVFVTWNKATMNVVGAWLSLSGITKNGTGEISGVDRANCGNGNVAGLSVPYDPTTHKADLEVNGNSFTPTGNPPYDTLKTFSQESTAVKLDWAAIKSGSAIQADVVIPPNTFPTISQFAADTNYWPVIHIVSAGSFSLPNKGRGMLIVDNDLDINGSNQWDGIILVGGRLTSNGNNVSEGATLSGLNRLLGESVLKATASVSDTTNANANGQKSYVYNSCSVAKAAGSMARYTMIPNTWMDNISGY